jgi:hypothetical protein
MKKLYIVYETDAWLSFASRDLIGVCTTFANCMKIIRKNIREWKQDRLSDEDKWNLENIRQTQGRERNFFIEEVEKNTLL